MEALPSSELLTKYQKLATEYSKLKVHVKVLKKGVLDEQAKSNELRDTLKEKEKALRKSELEIDSLTFRNQQLTRRVSVLQDELEAFQLKLTKKSKGKGDVKQVAPSNAGPLDPGLLQEELQKKIIENAQYASQLSDRIFEVSQLKASLEDYQMHINESESKYKCEIAKLKNKNQELQFTLEEVQKERPEGTSNKALLPSSSHAPSCNGDFLSEAGSLIGSEDALSSVGDFHVQFSNIPISTKTDLLEQENQDLKMEYELVKAENEKLKQELQKYAAASQKRRGDTHDSGDFNNFIETSVDSEGRVVGLLGSLETPFHVSEEVKSRENGMKTYFRNKITELEVEKELLNSRVQHYMKECDTLRIRHEDMVREREQDARTLTEKHDTISRLEEELHSTSHNYEQQMSVLTEHVAGLNEQLARQHDEVDRLRHQLTRRK